MTQVRISMLNTHTWAELSFAFEPTPSIVIASMAIATALGLFGGPWPALRATRIDPAQAMRGA